MQQAAKRAVSKGPAIAAAAAGAAAGSIVARDEAQCEAAPLATSFICASDIQAAGAMVKESLVLSRSQDGTEWIDVPSVQLPDLDSFVNLAMEVAEDPNVQRVIAAKAAASASSASALALASGSALSSSGELVEMKGMPSDADGGEATPGNTAHKLSGPADPPQVWGEDDELVRSLVGDPSLIASSLSTSSTSTDVSQNTQDQLELENLRLRRENDALRSALAVKEAMEKTDADITVEAKPCLDVSGKEVEEGCWACELCTFRNSPLMPFCEICEAQRAPYEEPTKVARAVVGPPPRVLTGLTVDADCHVHLSLRLQEVLPEWATRPSASGMPKQHQPTDEDDGPGCVAGQTALIAAAIIVGIVALLVTRNPKGAKAAAASAAAMVAGLFAKSRACA